MMIAAAWTIFWPAPIQSPVVIPIWVCTVATESSTRPTPASTCGTGGSECPLDPAQEWNRGSRGDVVEGPPRAAVGSRLDFRHEGRPRQMLYAGIDILWVRLFGSACKSAGCKRTT